MSDCAICDIELNEDNGWNLVDGVGYCNECIDSPACDKCGCLSRELTTVYGQNEPLGDYCAECI